MPAELEGMEIDAAEGKWRIEYIGQPEEHRDQDRVDYYVRIKWIDAHDPAERATPERRLRIRAYSTQEAYADYEERLRAAITRWVDGADETETVFDRESGYLLKPQKD